MLKIPLELIQGDSKCWRIQIRQNNVNINIAGWILFFTAKPDYTLDDDDATIAVTYVVPNNTDAQNGIAYLRLSSTDTNVEVKTYFYDIKYQSTERETIACGELNIIPTITKRTS
jgi:hypothetical protein